MPPSGTLAICREVAGRERGLRLALPALLAGMVVLSGCTAGPNYAPSAASVADHWIDSANSELRSDAEAPEQWWTVFDDPVLNELVMRAATQNLPLRIAGLRVIEARAERGIAVGEFFPQLQQFHGSYSRVRTSENLSLAGIPPGPQSGWDFWQTGFDASWELDVWGRFRRNIEASDASLQASVADYDGVLVTLIGDVASTYILIRTFEQRIELAEANVKLQENTLRIADRRFRNGLVTELDVTQAKSSLADTEALIPRLLIGLRRAEVRLAILLGQPPEEMRQRLGPRRPIPRAPREVAIGIPAELLRRRPDIRSAERRAAAQSARIGVAVTDLLPHFALAGSIGWQANSFDDVFRGGSLAGAGGPGLRWDILNYGRIVNNVRVQDARFEEAMVAYQDTVLRAAGEVEVGLVGFIQQQSEARSLAESVSATKRSVDLSLTQYREGIVDFIRVLDAQKSLVQLQDQLTASQAAIALELVAVYKALGGGWQIRRGQEFVPEETARQMAARTNWGDILSPQYSRLTQSCFPRPADESGPVAAAAPAGPADDQ